MRLRQFSGAIVGIAMTLALSVLTACEIGREEAYGEDDLPDALPIMVRVELPDGFSAYEWEVDNEVTCYFYGPGELVLLSESEGYALWEYRSGLQREPTGYGFAAIPEDHYVGPECRRGRRFGTLEDWNAVSVFVWQQLVWERARVREEQRLEDIRQRLERQADENHR
jgi:hypothetical protein